MMRSRSPHLAVGLLLVAAMACAAHRPTPVSTVAWPEGDPEAGKEAFIRAGCAACHLVRGVDGMPEPTANPPVPVVFGEPKPSRPTVDRLVESIANPDVHIAERHTGERVRIGDRSRMSDFTRVLTVRELIDIVAFLQAVHDEAQR